MFHHLDLHNLFNQTPMFGHLGCVQLFAIIIYTVQMLFCICTSVSVG